MSYQPISPRAKPLPPSPKQLHLLQLLADGGYYKGVADELGVTEDTVRQRVGYLRRKYDAVTTVHLVATCLRRGLIV